MVVLSEAAGAFRVGAVEGEPAVVVVSVPAFPEHPTGDGARALSRCISARASSHVRPSSSPPCVVPGRMEEKPFSVTLTVGGHDARAGRYLNDFKFDPQRDNVY